MPRGAAEHVDLERLAQDIRAWGRELGFGEIGIADTGCRGRGSASARVARRGPPRRDGLYGTPWRAPRAAGRARSRHLARDHRPARLSAARGAATRRGSARRLAQGLRLALRARAATITRCCGASCCGSRGRSGRGRRLQLSRVHRQRAGARSRARRQVGPGLARQAHAAADPRCRLVFLSRRDLHRPAARR